MHGTWNPELTRHMDARREQRELAASWRIARATGGDPSTPAVERRWRRPRLAAARPHTQQC